MPVTDPSAMSGGKRSPNGDHAVSDHQASPGAAAVMPEGTDINSIVRFMAARLSADSALLTVDDGRPDEPSVHVASGHPLGPTVLEGVAGRGSIGQALARGEPIARRLRAAPGEGDGPSFDAVVDEVLIAPVRAPSGISGALSLGWVEPLDEQQGVVLRALVSYAALIGLWLDDPPSLIGLLRAAYKDGLTGCLTLPALITQLEQEVRRAQRSGRPLSCLFVDLDRFKEVNDVSGHLAGNRVLAAIAEGMVGRVRDTDIVARYGGDEFVIVLPDTGTLGASLLADSIRSGVSESSAAVLGRPVEASVGVAEWIAGMAAAELVHEADEALGRARRRRGMAR